MRVIARTGFVATHDGKKYRVQAGDEIEMPAGADWLACELVEAVETGKKPAKRTKRAAKRKQDE